MNLYEKLMSCVSGEHKVINTMREIALNMHEEQEHWIADLRADGIKAAHPDDGWVNRVENTVFFAYPQFDDGVKTGDLIALGCPMWGSKKQTWRIVKVVGETVGPFQKRWAFEPVESVDLIEWQKRMLNLVKKLTGVPANKEN